MSQQTNPFDAIEVEAGKAVLRGVLRAFAALSPAADRLPPAIELSAAEVQALTAAPADDADDSTPAAPARVRKPKAA